MTDNNKHLANTYIEIPKDTVARWMRDAHEIYRAIGEPYKARCIEIFLDLRRGHWRKVERMKNTQNDNDLNWSDKLIEKDKRIKELEEQVESLKKQIK